jgi:hypothetical protein
MASKKAKKIFSTEPLHKKTEEKVLRTGQFYWAIKQKSFQPWLILF